jgi:hypothetical protein
MDDARRIKPERYNGYLTPWIGKIVALHDNGLSARQIAKALEPEIARRHDLRGYGPVHAMVSHVLWRVGAKQTVRIARATTIPAAGDATVYPWETEWDRREAAREARWNRIVDKWLAEKTERYYERIRLSNKGRPLDMGGPRDVWIERDPWSDL